MFSKILIERDLENHHRVQKIRTRFPDAPVEYLDKYDDVFGKVFRPYLQRRTDLQLFVGQKRGQLIKPAPDAYGLSGEHHYYFVHAYNCIYECEYCYLQGYFKSPDIVLFLNHADVTREMQATLEKHPGERVWFHAGEFSDSLALSHLSGELEDFWPFFEKNPAAQLELRTKSANLTALEKLEPLGNVHISMSLSPENVVTEIEHKTARYNQRLKALKILQERGFRIAIHLDPIIYQPDYESTYQKLLADLHEQLDIHQIAYVSLGVVRFTKDVYQSVTKNYPQSKLHKQSLVKSFDKKVRYSRPMRFRILRTVQDMAREIGFRPEQIYLCME